MLTIRSGAGVVRAVAETGATSIAALTLAAPNFTFTYGIQFIIFVVFKFKIRYEVETEQICNHQSLYLFRSYSTAVIREQQTKQNNPPTD
jgi:hypothetical protein